MLQHRKKALSYCFAIACLSMPAPSLLADTLLPISGHTLTENSIKPSDVLARAHLLHDELNLISLELGKIEYTHQKVDVSNVSPREVYFMAERLYVKSDHLAFENTQTSIDVNKKIDVNNIKPFHVWQWVNLAYERVMVIKKKLKIPESVKEIKQDDNQQPNDVIRALFLAIQEIDDLLDKKVSPSDAYQKITYAIHISAQLFGAFDGVNRIDDTPALQRKKTANEVYQNLYNSFQIVKNIAQQSNLKMLDFKPNMSDSHNQIKDIDNLATLIIAELAYFHSLLSDSEVVPKAYYPGRKILSEVFQRSDLLNKQLKRLSKQVSANPLWLQQ